MGPRVPYAKLGVPHNLEDKVVPEAPRQVRLALARGTAPVPAGAALGVLYSLCADPDEEVRETARAALRDLPARQVLGALSIQTHPKILEFLVEFRPPDREIDLRIGTLRAANDRTAVAIARRADADLCEKMAEDHERLLLTPEVFVALQGNPACSPAVLQRAEAFLRMQRALPEEPAAPPPMPMVAPKKAMNLEAEIEAALTGGLSPGLLRAQGSDLGMFDLEKLDGDGMDIGGGDFTFDFKDESDEFSWELTTEREGAAEARSDERVSIERMISDMSVGQRIKLAYLGNKEVRGVLIRDSNKIVSAAVVKSGRLSDAEVAAFAGNRNLDGEVLREIANNGEWTRKYPVKVALANNPKCPVSMAIGLVATLQKKDLLALTRNRNVSSVVNQAANRLYHQKYRQ